MIIVMIISNRFSFERVATGVKSKSRYWMGVESSQRNVILFIYHFFFSFFQRTKTSHARIRNRNEAIEAHCTFASPENHYYSNLLESCSWKFEASPREHLDAFGHARNQEIAFEVLATAFSIVMHFFFKYSSRE